MKNFIILNENKIDFSETLISKLDDENNVISIYSINEYSEEEKNKIKEKCLKSKLEFNVFSSECTTTPKRHNYILKTFVGSDKFIHIIKDNVRIKKDLSEFVDKIENMMNIFNLDSWFNTVSDRMNYVYSKHMNRLRIPIDVEEFKNLGIEDILFTSHANNNWTCYNMKTRTQENINEILFDEKFSVPMFFIIEYLARRRNNNKNSINMMNMYPTISQEIGLFDVDASFDKQPDKEVVVEEDKIFKSMNINFAPDHSIDRVLEITYEIMKSKIVK